MTPLNHSHPELHLLPEVAWPVFVFAQSPLPEPCPQCTDCNGNLCDGCEAEWQALLQDEGGEG